VLRGGGRRGGGDGLVGRPPKTISRP